MLCVVQLTKTAPSSAENVQGKEGRIQNCFCLECQWQSYLIHFPYESYPYTSSITGEAAENQLELDTPATISARAFSRASGKFSGFRPPAWAKLGLPPPPPPQSLAMPPTNFPACSPILTTAGLKAATRLTLPSPGLDPKITAAGSWRVPMRYSAALFSPSASTSPMFSTTIL